MCGIVGFLTSNHKGAKARNIADSMAKAIRHRGPDDHGVWTESADGIALAHRRLSILDVSSAGHQPMLSAEGRYALVFNGEIYNHTSLRGKLSDSGINIAWRGNSDTETLLACFDNWGINETLNSTVGMFALALWDRIDKKLYLARDRIGEKPLYYGWSSGSFLFGSELKALKAFPEFQNNVCRNALSAYLQYNYVPTPYSIYQNIYKLEPGTLLCLTLDSVGRPLTSPPIVEESYNDLSLSCWWSLSDVAKKGLEALSKNESEVLQELDIRLRESIRLQSVADVPLGAFLSGGLDSSLIVSLMQSEALSPVKTFTIGFAESVYNEAVYAKEVAQHLGTDHTELTVSPLDALDTIPRLPEIYDEPFSDSSQIPTFLVSKLAKEHVTVALSGDSGDELFGGYNRYTWSRRIWNKFSWLPYPARQAIGRLLISQPAHRIDMLANRLSRYIGRDGVTNINEKIHKVANLLIQARCLDDFYHNVVSTWKSPLPLVGIDDCNLSPIMTDIPDFSTAEERMMFLDTTNYLPDDILCKVDRAAMSVGLETRIPFLDHRVVEYAWQIPLSMKIKNGQGKWPLRQLLDQHVPKSLIERPKQGFSIPLGEWLRGPLREWAEGLLDKNRLRCEGYFDADAISLKWQQHLEGRGNWQNHLWSILMFQMWLDENNKNVIS